MIDKDDISKEYFNKMYDELLGDHQAIIDIVAMKRLESLHDEKVDVSIAMQEDGGGFIQALGLALRRADNFNVRKIKATWPEYWIEYLEKSKEAKNGNG